MGRWKSALIGAILVALGVGVGGWALAQAPAPVAHQLAQRLAQGELPITDHGFMRVAGPFAGPLAVHQTARVPITLRAGQVYRIFGVCGADCAAIDLRLYDAGATMIAENAPGPGAPLIEARPQRTGQYVVEVNMRRCAQAPCFYAFNVYAR